MTPISVCIIGRDEAPFIERMFKSIENKIGDYPHEVVFVDTGSTDNTIEIANKHADKVYSYAWADNFSLARNYAMDKASNDWIFFLDCDEEIAEFNDRIYEEIADDSNTIGMSTINNVYSLMSFGDSLSEMKPRLVNRRLHYYKGAIGEMVMRTNVEEPCIYFDSGIVITHYGLSSAEEGSLMRIERNMEILLDEVKMEGSMSNPDPHFTLGQYYLLIGDYAKSAEAFKVGLEVCENIEEKDALNMILGLGYSMLSSGNHEEAQILLPYGKKYESSGDFLCLSGIIYLRNGNIDKAMELFNAAKATNNSIFMGSNSYISSYNMGTIHELYGEMDEAIALYRECGNYDPAKKRLEELGFIDE